MPPRLAHTKSRHGCHRCKIRKVKCSETRPTCTSCARHGVECVYLPNDTPKPSTLHPPSSRQRASSSASPSPSPSHAAYPTPGSDHPSQPSQPTNSQSTSSNLSPHPPPLLPPPIPPSVPLLFHDLSPESPARRLLELRLLAHFLTVVILTFASNDHPAVIASWRHRLPALALRFPYLLNAILATAALHLAVGGHGVGMTWGAGVDAGVGVGIGDGGRGGGGSGSGSGDGERDGNGVGDEGMDGTRDGVTGEDILGALTRADYASVHQTYFDLVLSQHRAAIDVLSAENADAVCMTSVLISNHGFLLGARQGYASTAEMGRASEAGRSYADEGISGYEVPMGWLQLSAGIREVIRCANEGFLGEDAVVRVLMSSFRFESVDRLIRSRGAEEVFEGLRDWRGNPEPEGLEPAGGTFADMGEPEVGVREVYERALRYIGHIYLSVEGGESKARVARLLMGFTSMVPRAFVRLIEQGRPRALVVLAHLFAMTVVVGDVWWFRGAAERHVRGIGGIVPPEWQWAMEWPRRVIRREVWSAEFLAGLR